MFNFDNVSIADGGQPSIAGTVGPRSSSTDSQSDLSTTGSMDVPSSSGSAMAVGSEQQRPFVRQILPLQRPLGSARIFASAPSGCPWTTKRVSPSPNVLSGLSPSTCDQLNTVSTLSTQQIAALTSLFAPDPVNKLKRKPSVDHQEGQQPVKKPFVAKRPNRSNTCPLKYLQYFHYDPEEQNEDGTRHYTCTLCGFKNNGKAVRADACRKHIANLHKHKYDELRSGVSKPLDVLDEILNDEAGTSGVAHHSSCMASTSGPSITAIIVNEVPLDLSTQTWITPATKPLQSASELEAAKALVMLSLQRPERTASEPPYRASG